MAIGELVAGGAHLGVELRVDLSVAPVRRLRARGSGGSGPARVRLEGVFGWTTGLLLCGSVACEVRRAICVYRRESFAKILAGESVRLFLGFERESLIARAACLYCCHRLAQRVLEAFVNRRRPKRRARLQ